MNTWLYSVRVPLLRNYGLALVACGILSCIAVVATPYMAFATATYGALVLGYALRKVDFKAHGILMTIGVLGDLSLVLALEVQRHAVNTAMAFTLSPIQQTHVFCSSLATALYVPLLVTGLLLMKNPVARQRFRKTHSRIGSVALVFRTLGFLLMFSMLKHGSAG